MKRISTFKISSAFFFILMLSTAALFGINKDEDLKIDDNKYSPMEQKKSILDIERDFRSPFIENKNLSKWLFALDINGGFENKNALSGLQLLSGYREESYGLILSFPLIFEEQDREDKYGNLVMEHFGLKDTNGSSGYDYTDHWSDIFWYLQKAYYKTKTENGKFSLNIEDLNISDTTNSVFFAYSGMTSSIIQNRKPLHISYTQKNYQISYLNDDAVDLDFHLVRLKGRPVNSGYFSDWFVSSVMFIDTDLQDYGSYRFEDNTHSDYTLGAAGILSSLPVYKDIFYSILLDTDIFALKTLSGNGGFVSTGGLSYKRKFYLLSASALMYQGGLYPEPFLSPFFDTNRQLLVRDKPDFPLSFGTQFRLELFPGKKDTGSLLVRYFGENPGMYFGFSYHSGKRFEDPFFWSLAFFRRDSKDIKNLTDFFAANSLTNFSLSYFIYSHLEIAFNVFLQPMPLLSGSLNIKTEDNSLSKGEIFTRYYF